MGVTDDLRHVWRSRGWFACRCKRCRTRGLDTVRQRRRARHTLKQRDRREWRQE